MTVRLTLDNSRLQPEQIAAFHRDGFLGPLGRYADLHHLAAVESRLRSIDEVLEPQPIYGRYSPRDWHLVDERLLDLLTHPVLVAVLQQLLGPDLTLWRSKSFIKPPHGPAIGWHQEWGTFNGAELGNDVPALAPATAELRPWNVSVWIALVDIEPKMGPLRIVRGSHARKRPVAQVPYPDSAFYEDPFAAMSDPMEIVRRARASTLFLDVDTSDYFDGVDLEALSFDDARASALERVAQITGEVTLPFEIEPGTRVTLPMRAGDFVVFYERVLHGSAASTSPHFRSAVNCRVTQASTLIYPQRLEQRFVDGSYVDIRNHASVKLSGRGHHPDNVYRPLAMRA